MDGWMMTRIGTDLFFSSLNRHSQLRCLWILVSTERPHSRPGSPAVSGGRVAALGRPHSWSHGG